MGQFCCPVIYHLWVIFFAQVLTSFIAKVPIYNVAILGYLTSQLLIEAGIMKATSLSSVC